MKKIAIISLLIALASCVNPLDAAEARLQTKIAANRQEIANKAGTYCSSLKLKDDGTLTSPWYSCVLRQSVLSGYYQQ